MTVLLFSEYRNKYDEYFSEILRFYTRHGLDWATFVDLMRLINCHPDTEYKYPESKYGIRRIIPGKFKIEEYRECGKCDVLIQQKSEHTVCPECHGSFSKTEIMYLSFSEQLKSQMVKHSTYLLPERTQIESDICDIYDGEMYQKTAENHLPLTMNTDGISVFKSGGKSIWPIMVQQNYLPPNLRFKPENIILAGLFSGKKPNMKRLLLPFMDEMEQLFSQGVTITIENIHFTFRPVICACTVDLPAKHTLLSFVNFNGYHGCVVCEHPGTQIVRKSAKAVVRFKFQKNASPIRSHSETLKIMSNLKKDSPPVKGIKGVSALTSLQSFDIINGMTLDYMHSICQGVGKRLLSIWTNPKNSSEKFYLNKTKIDIINNRIAAIKPCSFIRRRPENIEKFGLLKAHQVKTLLLYYFLPCFRSVLPDQYLMHAQILFSTIYILLGERITEAQLEKSSSDLTEFVKNFEILYGGINMVNNVHSLLHLAWTVKNWGPLWTQSTFPFENMNGALTRLVKGNTHPLHQISTKYLTERSQPTNQLQHKRNFRCIPFKPKLSNDEVEALNTNGIDSSAISCYSRTIINDTIYTSCQYKNVKFIDYFVEVEDGSDVVFVKIIFFFQHEGYDFFLIEIYGKELIIDQYQYVKSCKKFDVFPTDSIKKKLMYIYIERIFSPIEVIIARPNSYEQE